MQTYSYSAKTVYQDLLRSLIEEHGAGFRGAPSRVTRNGRIYWYDTFRIGSSVRKRYVGNDSDELRKRLSRHQRWKAQEKDRLQHRMRLVGILRAEGFSRQDTGFASLMGVLARADAFGQGVTVIGSHAFCLYEGLFSAYSRGDMRGRWGGTDFATPIGLSLTPKGGAVASLEHIVSDFDFEREDCDGSGVRYRWLQSKHAPCVEFVSPPSTGDGLIRPFASLDLTVRSCPFVAYLAEDTIPAAVLYRSGVLVRVPKPERFVFYMLVASEQNWDQIRFLVGVLAEERQEELKRAFNHALSRSPIWWTALTAQLKKSPEISRILHRL